MEKKKILKILDNIINQAQQIDTIMSTRLYKGDSFHICVLLCELADKLKEVSEAFTREELE